MTVQHSPRHRAAGPAGFGRSPWPSQPIAVIPSPRPPSERPAGRTTAPTGETGGTAGDAPAGTVPPPRSPLVRLRAREEAAGRPAPRHAVPEGLAEVADLLTVASTPAPLAAPLPGDAPAPGDAPGARRRTGGAIVRLTAVPAAARRAGAPPATPPAPPRTAGAWSRGRTLVIGALAVVVVLTGAAATTLLVTGAFAARTTPPASPWAQGAARVVGVPAVAPVAPAPTVASPIATLSGDGRLTVGVEIASGTYRSAGPASPTHDCSWSRRGRGADGETVLASGVPTGPATVTVRAGDAVFVTRGCAPWTRVAG